MTTMNELNWERDVWSPAFAQVCEDTSTMWLTVILDDACVGALWDRRGKRPIFMLDSVVRCYEYDLGTLRSIIKWADDQDLEFVLRDDFGAIIRARDEDEQFLMKMRWG